MTKTNSISIQRAALQALLDHCNSSLPYEGCGLLFGYVTDRPQITSFVPVDNVASEPRHAFRMSPQQLISALYNQPPGNGTLLGVAHSHPAGPAVPSADDLESHWHTLPSHWIVSFPCLDSDGLSGPSYHAYRYEALGGKRPSAVPLVIRVIP
ncbi:Mov34/MPN/PAD-1 family protein [Paenibacillus puerhi]|uniref:Mov34/MPN/PAD-1 family protein n=1 Tax=Paenibacillus puerhi TaxID=2692622 RepID=UPI00135B0A91|nr:M67 family metallopeptidase [Paenibacillus puerhi]